MAAGIRIEPPPSLALAAGPMPVATAAAAPPDEPPRLRVGVREVGGGEGEGDNLSELKQSPPVIVDLIEWPEEENIIQEKDALKNVQKHFKENGFQSKTIFIHYEHSQYLRIRRLQNSVRQLKHQYLN